MYQETTKRVISLLLCAALLVGNFPMVSFAAEVDGLCPHHETHAECGYVDGEADCGYVCELCAQATEETTESVATAETEATKPDCTGLSDCAAENHQDTCEKQLALVKDAVDQETANAVAAQIEALPTLEALQDKPMAEQLEDYEQVQNIYSAYCALSADQQALLPPAEEVFKPYFDYFNSLVSLIWSGSGTATSPFRISTEKELQDLAKQVAAGNTYSGKYFQLTKDIALTNAWTPIGTATYAFRGSFDGNGKTISGMTANGDYIGLFGYVGSGAVIQNLKLTDIDMDGIYYVAGLAAYVDAGSGSVTISNCQVSGSVYAEGENEDGDEYGSYGGGIVAYANATNGTVTIKDCTMSGRCDGDTNVGGIIGCGQSSGHKLKLQNCINHAAIPVGSNSNHCGGIAGSVSSAELTGCINYGSVSGNAYSEDNGSSWLGGITGGAGGCTFNGCANFGAVSTFYAGGITASQSGGNVANSCLNAGQLAYSSDGFGCAILYYHNTTNIATNCYYLYGPGMTGATSISSAELSSGAVAYWLRDYFGQTIGVDERPVPLTSSNRVYQVTVIGEATGTYYVNYGGTVTLPELNDCAAYFDGEDKFDPETPITRDYALAAKGYHEYEDGVCIYCGNEGVNYIDVGTCGASAAWVLTESGVLTISGSGAMTDYTSAKPAPWSSYASRIVSVRIDNSITTIGDYAFKDLTNVTSVTLGDSINKIGEYAFYGMVGLTSLTLGDAITSIGDYAFSGCSSVTSLTWGKQLKNIGNYAFSQCVGLRSISIPAAVTSIGNGAFQGCSELYYVGCTGNLQTIGDYAFAQTKLEYITLPASLTSLGDYAFQNCDELWLVTFEGPAPRINPYAFSGNTVSCHVPNYDSSWASTVNKNYGGTLTWSMGDGTCGTDVKWYLDFTGTLHIYGSGNMQNSSISWGVPNTPWASVREKVLAVVIEEGVTSIGDYAFYGFTNLTSVTIADSVTKIGTVSNYTGYGCSFMNCTSLTQITIPKNVTSIAYSTFEDCSSLTTITVASGNTAYSSADGILYDRYKDAIHCYPAGKTGAFTIPSTVDKIMPYAFATCKGLTEVTIPATVTSIGNYAFYDCYGLDHVTFLGSAPSFGSNSFTGVTTTVDYPAADTSWTHSVMKSAGGTNLTWNGGSGSCGTGVQWKLTYKYSTVTLTISGSGAMSNYTSGNQPWANRIADITAVEVCNGVTSVGEYALYNSNALTTVMLADTVTSIGTYAFGNCTKLTSVTLGNGIQTIGDNAFRSTKISYLTLPNSLRTVGNYAFSYCQNLQELTFGNNLTSIGSNAFVNCSLLKSVNLGSSVQTLDQSAFNGCTALTKIVIPASVTTIGKYAFRNCTALQYVEFLGNAPSTFDSYAFDGVTCNAYYLTSKSGWTSSTLTNHGGTLTWGIIFQRGDYGRNAEWILDTAGNLFICGSGRMDDYSKSRWYDYRDSIKTATVRGVTSITNYAFEDCSKLQVVILVGSTPSFSSYSFKGATCEIWYTGTASTNNYGGTLTWRKITSQGKCGTNARWALDSNGNLVILGTGAMTDYYSTSSIPWYSSTASIKSAIIKGEITKIGRYAFWCSTALETVTIGSSVTAIGDYAFNGCDALKTLYIGDNVTSIGERAVSYCDALKTVTIGAKVTSIGSSAFAGCSTLESVTFMGNAPGISYNAFQNVTTTAYYPISNSTWTSSKKGNYNGTLTWVAQCTNHKEVIDSAKAATCTQTGLTEGKHCSLCNEVLVEQTVIPALGHYALNADNVSVPVDTLQPDCVNDIICTVCKQVAKAAVGHRVLGTVPVEADPLTITNHTTYPWTLNNGTYYSTNKKHDSYSYLQITAKYACTLTLIYGASSEEDYDELEIYHNYTRKASASGEVDNLSLTLSLAAGDIVKVCYDKDEDTNKGSNRGWVKLVYDPVMVDGVGDVPAETAEPDCTNGVICRYCQTVVKSALGHRVKVQLPEPETPYEIISNFPHTFQLDPADGFYYSTNKGKKSTTAEIQFKANSDCTLILQYGVSSEANYDYLRIYVNGVKTEEISDQVQQQNVTWTLSAGDIVSVQYSKDDSGNRYMDKGWVSVDFERGPTEAIVPVDSIEASCEELICAFCNAVAKEAQGHDWDGGVERIPATETTEGEMFYTCQRCDATKTEVIPVVEHVHRHNTVVTPPTCTEDGYTTYICSCGDTFTADPVVTSGHDWSDWTTVDATCTEDGSKSRACRASNCDETEQETIPAGHKVENGICTLCKIHGICGDHVTWDFDEGTGRLTISGTGAMADYNQGRMTANPWYSLREDVTAVIIEDGITRIGDYAFSDFTQMYAITLPASVESIGNCAFQGCCVLTDIFIEDLTAWINIQQEGEYARPTNNGTATQKHLYLNRELVTDLVIPEGITSIPANAFGGCVDITTVLIPNGVQSIDLLAFSQCAALKSVTIPDSVTSIGTSAFLMCNSLTDITIPDGVTTIGDDAFNGCSSLTSIVIPDSVTEIGWFVFNECRNLNSVTLGNNLTWISPSMFRYCTSLTEITIPDSVGSIAAYAFIGCGNLSSVTIGSGVTTVGAMAFAACSALTSIVLPDGVTRIDDDAFSGSGLTSITIPASLREIGLWAFDGCAIVDVYYGGTAEQWEELGQFRPTAEYIHYGCTVADNHWQSDILAPTCTAPGYTREKCACDYIRNETTEPATGDHIFDQEVADEQYLVSEASCTKPAIYYRSCVCGEASEETFEYGSAKAHIEETIPGKAPTATEPGLTDGVKCSECGEILVEQTEIPVQSGIGDGYIVEENDDDVELSLALEDYVHNNFFFTVNGFDGLFESIDPATGKVEDIGLLVFYTRLPNSADCTVETADEVIEGGTYDYEKGMYKVRSNGIAAKDMGDDVWYKMYVKTANGYVYSAYRYKFSPRLYALDVQTKTNLPAELKALCVALMNYGADAQVYFAEKNGYKYDQLMNVGFEKYQNLVKDFDSSVITARGDWNADNFTFAQDSKTYTDVEYFFSLESALVFNFNFITEFKNIENAGALVWTYEQYLDGQTSVDDATIYYAKTFSNGGKDFAVGYPGLAAKEMDSTFFACGFVDTDEGRVYSSVVRRNIDYLANWIIEDKDTSDNYKQLMKTMTLYGEYADIYFSQK